MSSFSSSSDYNLQIIRGIPQNPTIRPDVYEDIIDNFETNNGDTFVTSYVEAGIGWAQQMLHLILRSGEPGGSHSETIPWLKALSSHMLAEKEAPTWTLERIDSIREPRFFKSHATVDHLPRGLADIKVIYVARNPKDTVVSMYSRVCSEPEYGYSGDFESFCKLFLEGKVENGSWFDHVLDWYRECQNQPESHIFLMYEEIFEHPAIAVQLLADLLEMPCSDEVCAKVVLSLQTQSQTQQQHSDRATLRKGGIGQWRDYFSVAMSEAFDEVYLARMKDSGLRFNFGPNAQGKEVYM